jgi:DNA polymerase elongation subunit (family B)
VLDAEDILDESWAEMQEGRSASQQKSESKWVTNKEVGIRFDAFIQERSQNLVKEVRSQTERECLEQFLQVLKNLRPHLIQCYDVQGFPRTNNEMEGAIRKMKTSYRRISGRKNWNAFLLRHGRNIAFYDWWGGRSTEMAAV